VVAGWEFDATPLSATATAELEDEEGPPFLVDARPFKMVSMPVGRAALAGERDEADEVVGAGGGKGRGRAGGPLG
jgi:hypothetical protein